MTITLIAGARPNYIKIAPIIDAIKQKQADGINLHYQLIHTGQHYDKNLSETFFEVLHIPAPHLNIIIQSGSRAQQTAAIIIGFKKFFLQQPTDLAMVVGAVTSTMACSIVAKKAGKKIEHVEAGIQSGDISMPENLLSIPLRNTTEDPETCSLGTNELDGTDPQKISAAFEALLSENWKIETISDLWDGRAAAEPNIDHVVEIYGLA